MSQSIPVVPPRPSAGPVKGGPPSWAPFKTALTGALVGAAMLILTATGVIPMTLRSVPYLIIPGMIVAFTLAATAMGWMFLLFGRFGRHTRWLWPTCILIGVIILELFAMTYVAARADQLQAETGINGA